jgi:hypothetical protein
MPRWGRARVTDISSLDFEAWLNGLKPQDGTPLGGSKPTIKIVAQVVLDFAVEDGALSSNPLRQPVRRKRVKRQRLAERILSRREEPRVLARHAKRFRGSSRSS